MLILGQVFPASFFTFYNGGIEYMQPIIKAVDLSYTYMDLKGQELLALDKINLTINPGDIYGFVGHNGAGKTTLLKSIAGIISFDEGEMVRINEGPFANFNGIVEDFDMVSGLLKLNVSIFGRNTPVQISYTQVERVI